MLKEKRQFFEALCMALDLLVVSAAWIVSYWLRFQSDLIPADKGIPPFSHYLTALLPIWFIWAFVFRWIGLYKPMRGVRSTRELLLILNGNAFAVLLFIAFIYLFREKSAPFSRLVFLYFWSIATVFTAVSRSVLRFFLKEARRKGYNLRYVLIVGDGRVAEDTIERIKDHRELGMQVIGCLTKEGTENRGPMGIPVVGGYEDLGLYVSMTDIDQVVIALPLEDHHRLPSLLDQIADSLVDVRIIPDLYRFVSLAGAIEEFEGLPVISIQRSPLEGGGLLVKRAIDFCGALALMVVLAPVMAILSILIKLTSRGPIFYRQERVSVDGSRFNIYKFRTMRTDAESHGPGWTTRGDSRVTWLGKILRSTSLDELPQIYNVLRGDMSIVGPRPERPVFIEEFRKRVPRYMLRHKVPAGITGWAQVNGWRGDTSIDKRIEYDLYYIENWSVLLDIKILLLTIVKGFRDRNAY